MTQVFDLTESPSGSPPNSPKLYNDNQQKPPQNFKRFISDASSISESFYNPQVEAVTRQFNNDLSFEMSPVKPQPKTIDLTLDSDSEDEKLNSNSQPANNVDSSVSTQQSQVAKKHKPNTGYVIQNRLPPRYKVNSMRNPLSSQSSNFSPNTSGNILMPKIAPQSISPTKENSAKNSFSGQAIYPNLCASIASDIKETSQDKAEEGGSHSNEQNNDETIIYESASEPSQLYLRISSMIDEKESNGKSESDDGIANIAPPNSKRSKRKFIGSEDGDYSDSCRSDEALSLDETDEDDDLNDFVADDNSADFENDSNGIDSGSDSGSVISINSDYDPEEPIIYKTDPKEMFIKFFTNLKPNPALQHVTQDELTKMRAEVTPPNLKVDLLDHQVRGVHWMMSQEKSDARGGILADDMGLGKTLQTICLLLNHRPSKKTRLPTLIVLPVSLINQWQKEIRSKTQRGLNSKTLSIFIHHGKTKAKTSKKFVNYDIVLTTYNQVAEEFAPKIKERKNSKERSEKRVRTIHGPLHRTVFYRVVLDEAQYIKNEKAKSSRGCCNLKAKYRWCLSGTPLQNNTAEAYSLIKFLRVKPYYYYNLFQAHIDSYAKGMQSEIGLKRLHLFLQTIMLRRTKTSQLLGKPLLELPARNIHEIKVQFSEYEREAYDSLASKCIEKFKFLLKSNEIRSNFTYILVLLLRMRQACCHLKLVHDAIKNTDNDDLNEWNDDSVILQQQADKDLGLDEDNSIATSSAKVKALITKLNEIHEANAKSKVIIFSQFTKMLDIIEHKLESKRIGHTRLDGSMNIDQRNYAIEKLQKDPRITVLLISLKAGSVGLNLNFANCVILMDLWWNPMVEEQAIDRVHRIGQKNEVNIFRITVENTIEDRILNLQERKRLLIEGALSGKLTDVQVQKLNEKDLIFLFGQN